MKTGRVRLRSTVKPNIARWYIQHHRRRCQPPPPRPLTVPRAHAPKQLPPSTHRFSQSSMPPCATFYSYQHYLRHAILISTSIAPHFPFTQFSSQTQSRHTCFLHTYNFKVNRATHTVLSIFISTLITSQIPSHS